MQYTALRILTIQIVAITYGAMFAAVPARQIVVFIPREWRPASLVIDTNTDMCTVP